MMSMLNPVLLTVTDYNQAIDGIGNILSFGFQMLLIGMGTVFAVLAILWGALELFRVIFEKAEQHEHKKEEPAPVVAQESAEPATEDDQEIIAVIAAAVAAANQDSGSKFRVVSFRRK